MPPEPLPWDRKDFFKERKHERSEPHDYIHPHPHTRGGGGGGGGFGGVGGFGVGGGGPRWREPPHPHAHRYSYGSPRWVSDFRYRPPPGYSKQGSRHLYSEDNNSHGFVPTRPSDRILDDENFRASGPGKYGRNSREPRASFGQKDWKSHSYGAAPSPNDPGRPNGASEQQSSMDEMLTCNSYNPLSGSANSLDQSDFKDQNDKIGNISGTATSGQKFEREISLGSLDWKTLKWTRSGSFSSRGSGFSHSSSSKSMGTDSIEMKAEQQPRNATPIDLPSGHTSSPAAALETAFETSAAPSDETSSRKKPRLGWGEGLAKYEKKKVETHDDTATKNGLVICSSNKEPVQLHSLHLADKSPRVAGFSDCASPATPSSVGCSSSPGLAEKQFMKSGSVDLDTTNLSISAGIVAHNQIEGPVFNLENLDLAPISHLNSAIIDLLQSHDSSSADSGFFKSTAINKLLLWKGDVLKALEVTESEIDMLEGELKLTREPKRSCPCPAASSSLNMDMYLKPADDQDAASDITRQPTVLELVSAGDNDLERRPNQQGLQHSEIKDDDVDSPGSATSKFVEVPFSGKDVCPTEPGTRNEVSMKIDTNESTDLGVKCSGYGLNGDKGDEVSTSSDSTQLRTSISAVQFDEFALLNDRNDKLYESILASNRESANRATEVFVNLLPNHNCALDISNDNGFSFQESNPFIKEKFLRRKQFLQFKEKVLALKFRVYQHLWKEDIHLISMRKLRVKSQKKMDISLRAVNSGLQKHRILIRSRGLSPVGNLSMVPSSKMVNYVSKLISESQVKPLRNTLKMPSLILDRREKTISRFVTTNGLVEDPCVIEQERSMINPWTMEEKEIFMNKLATFGKDFRKIASFLTHKTTADCVEFYYKNHKSECFRKTKKKPEFATHGKAYSANNYLITSGKRWNREANAASLDILGAASAIAASVEDGIEIQQKCLSKYLLNMSCDYKTSRGDTALLERSSSLDDDTERETVAADVLAGICGSLSSEAMSSCITSAVDPGEGYNEWKCQRMGSSTRWPLTPEVTQNVDEETCSDESCGEMDPTDWTDSEKSVFIQAVSSYGKDFAMISRCVRTRSMDQCKVFFSKARKCLGLDKICPDAGNAVRNDANCSGSDIDDACVVETGPVICSEKSGVKLEVDLPSSDAKLNTDLDLPENLSVKHDLTRTDESNRKIILEHLSSELLSKDAGDNSLQKDKLEQDCDINGDVQNAPSCETLATQNQGTLKVPSGIEVEDAAEDANEHPDAPDVQAHSTNLDGLGSMLPGRSATDNKDKVEVDLCNLSCADEDIGSRQQISVGNSDTANDTDSSSDSAGSSGYEQKASLQSDSAKKSYVIPLQQSNYLAPVNFAPQMSVSVQCVKSLNGLEPSMLDTENVNGMQVSQVSRASEHRAGGRSLLGSVGSSQLLTGQVAIVSTTREMVGASNCDMPVALQNIPKLDRNFQPYLKKCNGAKHGSVAELAFQSQEQLRNSNHGSHLGSTSDVGKPCRNGDVKLFGQILAKPLSQQKPSPSMLRNGVNVNQHSKIGTSLNVKFSSDQSVGRNLAQTKMDCNKFLGSDNIPARTYGFWDGNRIQTGFPSLPDSAVLLAKYPAAFSNYAVPSSKVEQLSLHGVNGSERNLNGAPIFPAREIGSSSGATDIQVYRNRELQPFTLDTKQRQEALILEMQRRNGFDVASNMQQAARGMVGINVVGRGGIVVGGQCTGVSDPVAAIKMHYAQADQYNGQAGSIIREDDSWRGKGNLGR